MSDLLYILVSDEITLVLMRHGYSAIAIFGDYTYLYCKNMVKPNIIIYNVSVLFLKPHFLLFRCNKSNCRMKSRVTRAIGTCFENMKIPLPAVFQIMFLFSHSATYDYVRQEVRDDDDTSSLLSSTTIAEWYNYCREAIFIYELEHQSYDVKIGGPNKIVQIDNCKFGKQDEHWVLGMVEDRSNDLRLEVCPNNVRTAEVLVPLIKKHVMVGSIIHTDSSKAYDTLPQHGYIHKKVYNSNPINRFVEPDGTHTQRIVSHWNELKRAFANDRNKVNFNTWLVEYLWRRKVRINHKDPFQELLNIVKHVQKIK